MSQGITQEFDLSRGSRQKGKLDDMMDDPDAQEALRENVRACYLNSEDVFCNGF